MLDFATITTAFEEVRTTIEPAASTVPVFIESKSPQNFQNLPEIPQNLPEISQNLPVNMEVSTRKNDIIVFNGDPEAVEINLEHSVHETEVLKPEILHEEKTQRPEILHEDNTQRPEILHENENFQDGIMHDEGTSEVSAENVVILHEHEAIPEIDSFTETLRNTGLIIK